MVVKKGLIQEYRKGNMYVYSNEIVRTKIGVINYTYIVNFLHLFRCNFIHLKGGLVKI